MKRLVRRRLLLIFFTGFVMGMLIALFLYSSRDNADELRQTISASPTSASGELQGLESAGRNIIRQTSEEGLRSSRGTVQAEGQTVPSAAAEQNFEVVDGDSLLNSLVDLAELQKRISQELNNVELDDDYKKILERALSSIDSEISLKYDLYLQRGQRDSEVPEDPDESPEKQGPRAIPNNLPESSASEALGENDEPREDGEGEIELFRYEEEEDAASNASPWQWFLYFCSTLTGILFKAIWDAKNLRDALHFKNLKAIVIAPVIFYGLYTALQTISATDGLLAVLLAFQNGFFWQQMIEGKASSTA